MITPDPRNEDTEAQMHEFRSVCYTGIFFIGLLIVTACVLVFFLI